MMRWVARVLARFAARQPLGAAGAVIVLALVATAALAPQLAPHGAKEAAFAPYLPPSAEFPFGTDQIGRDILSRVIWGARLSLYVGLVSVMFGITFGGLWGVVTAYFGGAADMASQRVVDTLMALPPIILALSLMAALGQSVNNVILALTLLLTPTAARTLRSLALSIRESAYVEAARAAGCSHWRVIALHVLPNTFATYIVLVTVNISYAIVVEASLSFLGLDRAQLLLAQLRKIGIRGTLKSYESAAGFAVFGKGDFTMIATQDRAMDTTDPGDVFSLVYTTQAGSNWGKFSDPKADDLALQALTEIDRAKRVRLYHDLQRHLLHADLSAVPVAWVDGYYFRDKKLMSYKHGWTAYDNNTFMKVWLKE